MTLEQLSMAELGLIDTDDQADLRAATAKFAVQRCSLRSRRASSGDVQTDDRDAWAVAASELGMPGVAIPHSLGGAGLGLPELSVVVQELGRHLALPSFLSGAGWAPPVLRAILAAAPDPLVAAQLLGIARGDSVTCVACWTPDDPYAPYRPLTGRSRDDGLRLTGRVEHVLGAATADTMLTLADIDGTTGLVLVRLASPGILVNPLETLDLTRGSATVVLSDAPGTLLGGDDASGRVRRALPEALVAVASEALGGAEECLRLAVEYAGVRRQFGRAIGSFQAVKHMCARTQVRVEGARTAVTAARQIDDVSLFADDQREAVAAIAAAVALETFADAAATCMQVHGGIGFTWEHDAHLYLRRAKALQHVLGAPWLHRRRVGQLLGA